MLINYEARTQTQILLIRDTDNNLKKKKINIIRARAS